MICEGDRLLQFQPLGAQHGKEILRMGNCRQRNKPLAAQGVQRHRRAIGPDGSTRQLPLNPKMPGRRRARSTQHQIHRARPGFAQRPRREEESVAQPLVMEQANFDVAGQAKVLQAVIAQDDRGRRVLGQKRDCRLPPVVGDKDRHAQRSLDQQRLVAKIAGRAVG